MPVMDPSVGLDRYGGGSVTGWMHVLQSIEVIFSTSFGERVMREWFGSFVPNLLGRNITAREVTPFFAAIASGLEQWEPRYRVTRVNLIGSGEQLRSGQLHMEMQGQYRPRALLGDFAPEGARSVSLLGSARGLSVFQRLAS